MAKIEFIPVEGEQDAVLIKVTGLGEKGRPSSTGKSEVRGFGSTKLMASDGAAVVLGLNVYTR